MSDAKGNVLGGALLVAGTTIGGGMLALPVLTSHAGFLPSICIFFLCWLFMVSTGLLLLEVTESMKGESNIVSMAEKTLGNVGRCFAWMLYLFLFYCLNVAYMVGCGNIVTGIAPDMIPAWLGPIVFVLIFAPLILIPTVLAGKLNIGLVVGLALSYLGFVIVGFKYIDLNNLSNAHWTHALSVLPIAFTAFAYQGIIPTLASYMHHDIAKTRKAILLGSMIPFIAYIIWQALILGIVPIEGVGGLSEALKNGDNAVVPLKNFINNASVYFIGQCFAFFALITSFLGVSLGLRDFLADGLKIHKNFSGKLIVALLVFFPPLIIAVSYPHVFLIALDYAGGFGCALLLGLLPIMMVWVGRSRNDWVPQRQLSGGKPVLFLLGVFVVCEVIFEIKHLFG